jgi:hypothetical protein
MKFLPIMVLLLLNSPPAYGQFEIFPPGLNFTPLKAGVQESRIGVFKFSSTSDLKVDIGNSVDLVGLELPEGALKLTAGIDFMAYAFAANAEGLRLQVEAVDGFFGGNISLCGPRSESGLSARLRILHHSAHMADGHYISGTKTWREGREPIPFTRDFGELVLAKSSIRNFGCIRYYGGISYATLIRPAYLKRFSFLGGAEISFDRLLGDLAGKPLNLYISYNISALGTPQYAASHHLQAGLKLGKWFEKGISLYLSYYSGIHPSGEFFDTRLSALGAGFTVDFF